MQTRFNIQLLILMFIFTNVLWTQQFRISPNDTLQSPSIASDGTTTFRLFAPNASIVTLGGTDIPDYFKARPFTKQPDGVWETTIGPLPAGSYRYLFVADSVGFMDPRNTSVSESNAHSWSLFHVPGAEFMDLANVPHGTVSEVYYFSSTLNRFRRMHVYTPPGYESGNKKYPVLYLLHGAFDSDDSWSTVGRAGIILDNLIANRKAVPMIVVMPTGHTGLFSFNRVNRSDRDLFPDDFVNDLKPYIEKKYRIHADRKHRAIAGLSMGGMHALNISIPHLDEYSHIGVFSSGIFELGGMDFGTQPGSTWEERNAPFLNNKKLKQGLRSFWFATGKEDFLVRVSTNTVDLLKKYGFNVDYKETNGGHTWANWREYLHEFVPLLFK